MLNEIIAIYAITDDLLKAIGHKEDYRRLLIKLALKVIMLEEIPLF
jgi:hypothetical protein